MSFPVDLSTQQVHLQEAPPSQTEAVFPESLENLEVQQRPFPDTTNTVFLARDKDTGKQYVVKHNQDAEFVKNEKEANLACRALGLSVPNAKLLKGSWQAKEGNFLVLEYLEGAKDIREKLTGNPELDRKICDTLAKDFIVCSLFGLWDVVGLCFNNILFADDQHYYIDQGLSFGYMHNGKLKSSQSYLTSICADTFPFKQASELWETGNAVPEIVYLRDFGDRLGAAYLYQHLTTKEIQDQINALDLSPLRALAEKGEFPQETLDIIERRANWLKSVNLKSFEEKWKSLADARGKAVVEAEAETPIFQTRGIELIPAIRGGCFPQISEAEDPANRPPKVAVIYREDSKDEVWLAKSQETGKYSHLAWDAKDPSKNYIWEVTLGAGKSSGTRVRLSGDFISSSVNNTRYYVVDRMGGIPIKGFERFTIEEALNRLEGTEKQVLEAYLHAIEPATYPKTSSIQNLSPIEKKRDFIKS